MNWTDPMDLSGLVLVLAAAFVGFLLPLILRRGREAAAAERATLVCKIVSMALALAGVVLLILL